MDTHQTPPFGPATDQEDAAKRRTWQEYRLQRAKDYEKNDPEQAATLYSAAICEELRGAAPGPDVWRRVPYLFNRLTGLLERLRQPDLVLAEIKRYESLPCGDAGDVSDREAIARRKTRLTGRTSVN